MSDRLTVEDGPEENQRRDFATAGGGVPLCIAGLTIHYPGRREDALADVSFEVSGGSIVGVAGRTGAGKSSLALAAAGFIPRIVRARLGGRVTVAGIDTATATASDLLGRVGIVFATPANQLSASKLTVREELAFGLENLGVPRLEMDPRIDAILTRLGIVHLADREPFALSGGEQQRVAIASIVAMGTSVLVLDEPTAQLDPLGTALVADLLEGLARDGTAILIVEHDPAVLSRTDQTVLLDGGRVAATGLPGEVLRPDVLGPRGLRPPTLVVLAEAAGVEPALAFDEEAIAAAISARPPTQPTNSATGWEVTSGWRPIRPHPPVAIEIEELRHVYPGDVEALAGVSLRVEPGESIAIVGENGSGKTTLAKHLNGLLRPFSGRVQVGGGDIADEPVHRLAGIVGFVFQNPDDQLFERSVGREVAFGPRNLGLSAVEAARLVDAALEVAGLKDVREVNPYDLDLSRRKLVALASVLALDPAVLVLDEPTTGQDSSGVARVASVVEAFVAAGRSVVAISHDMEFAARSFRRLLVMRAGQVILDGTPSAVFGPWNTAMLASAGIAPPPAARIGARLGLGSTPTEEALVAALERTRG